MNKQTKKSYFLSQPHQPFFLLGVINAVVVMLIFALNYKGVLSLQVGNLTFHVYSLVFLVFTNVFTGFLFTTFPRFNQTDVIKKSYYTTLFFTQLSAAVMFLIGSFLSLYLVIFAMLTLLISQLFIILRLYSVYKSGQATNKTDSFWILNANYFGLLGNALFILSLFFPLLLTSAIDISFYLYLIFLSFSVAQRMVPFFSHSFAQKNENFVKIIFVLFLAKVLFNILDIKVVEIIVDLLLGIYLSYEFLRWKLSPFTSPPIMWILHLALFWLPMGFLLSAISLTAEIFLDTSFYFLALHTLAIGFLTTLLIGFGTRVTLGHSGAVPSANNFDIGIFFFIQTIVLIRTLFSINVAFGWGLNFLFDISFTLWLVLFLVWGAKYGKILIYGSKP